MRTPRLLAPCVALFVTLAATPATGEDPPSCVVDIEAATSQLGGFQTKDVVPLSEGAWVNDVYVLPYSYPDTYDRRLPSGLDNVQARQWVSQSFFAHNPDTYDFLAVVTGFGFDAGWGQHGDPTHALYWGVKNDTSGLGLGFFDNSQIFGSHRLQGYIDANSLDLVLDPNGHLDADELLTILSHELGHRWLAYCDFVDRHGTVSPALRGVDDSHWSYLLDSDGSYMYGADWMDNGDGSFTASEIKTRYSDLDLYLMGMLSAEEAGTFTLLENPSVPPDQYPETGVSVAAAPTLVAVDDIVAAEGPRIPSARDSQRDLRIAVIYLIEPGGQIPTEELEFLISTRELWQRRFFAQTEGRGVIGVGRNSLPTMSPPTLDLAAAVDWLTAQMDGSGSWQDDPTTRSRDSAAAITALDVYGAHPVLVETSLDALANTMTDATEIEAWRAQPLARHSHPDADALLDQLSAWVLDEGAWGGGLRYAGDIVTTARVARALAAGQRISEAAQALQWIGDRQKPDGGWSWRDGGPSSAAPTLEVVNAAVTLDPGHWNQPAVQDAVTWLLARRSMGGFGEPHPDIAETSLFLTAAREQPVSQEIIEGAIAFLAGQQRSDGSWGGSVYQTALAISALTPHVQPDLSVSPSELVVEPENPFVDDELTLLAAVRALNGDIPAGVSYRWEVVDSTQTVIATLDGVLPPIPATLFATVTDTWDLRYQVSPGTYAFRFVVDPLQELAEADESNNTAELDVTFRDHAGWIDLELNQDMVNAYPGSVSSVPQTVVIDGLVRNTGYIEARDAIIAVYESGMNPALAATTVTVPPTGEAPFQLTIQITEARSHHLDVIADPDDLLNDADPSNNLISIELGATESYDPAVVPGSLAVTPATGVEAGDLIALDFDLANFGTQPVSGLQVGVSFTAGNPPSTTPIRLLDITEEIGSGSIRPVSIEWQPPIADPDLRILVEVDPNHLVNDANRSNNTAEIGFPVAASPLPNLVASHTQIVFDPDPAIQHGNVQVSATVANPTDNPAGAFLVRLWIDEIGTGVLIGETTVTGLAPGGEATVITDWLVDEMADRKVWLDVDANNEITEFNEDDNQDFRVLDVLSIPDLVVTSGQVGLDPPFPRTGDVVQVDVTVLNTGDQEAIDVDVELSVVGGSTIGTRTIPAIPGGEAASVSFDWATDGIIGDVTLRVTADPSDTIVELDEDNNRVDFITAVQDADLWVTERYISPNGDGIRDATTIFVREGVDSIEVVDPWGEVVRMLGVNPPGQTVWDGRREDGGAVRDGVYELLADGLRSWVEVDLNQVTITDDVRQPLITGNVPTSSSHPSAEFRAIAPSPVDGVVYLTERLGGSGNPSKVWRWNGERLEDVPDWPDGHWTIRQMSAAEDVFITWNGDFSLIRFPGPQIDGLPHPAGYAGVPHLSPDGEWILWVCSLNSFERSVVLQRADDLGETFDFGPYAPPLSDGWDTEPTTHWAPDSTRALVGMYNQNLHGSGEIGLALDLQPGSTPTVREVLLDQSCGSIQDYGALQRVFASVDFEKNILTCIHDQRHSLHVIDLQTGSTLESADLPVDDTVTANWYRLSNDGRAVEVDEFVLELKNSNSGTPHFLLDWRRGLERPWSSFGYGYGAWIPAWSAHDRYWYPLTSSGGTRFFQYRTPAANLAVTLDPVVRFGGSGIDLFLTVTDKNLDSFLIEYAPASDPSAFEPLGQPSRDVLLGKNWGTWIPPSQGTWRIRLTAVDLAGNQRSETDWVTWNGVSDIAGLWTETRHISPIASPGVHDNLVWQYTVLRPSQLLFEIVDESGALITSIPVGASQPGPMTTTWDGRDDAGRPAPDGDYFLVFRGAEWPVTIDNTPPVAGFTIDDNGLRPTTDEIDEAAQLFPSRPFARSALFNLTSWSIADENLESAAFETRHIDQGEWSPVSTPPLFAPVNQPDSREAEVRSEWWSERLVRQVATDRAGNRSVTERFHREEQIAFAVAEPPCREDDEPCLFPDRPDVNELRDADGLMDEAVAVLWPHYSTILVQASIWGDWRDSLRLEFRVPGENGLPPGDWQPGGLTMANGLVWRRPMILTGVPNQPIGTLQAKVLPAYWEHPGLPLRPYEVRLTAQNRDGDEIVSPTALMVPKAPLAVEYLSTDGSGDHFRVHNIGTVRIDDIVLLSSQDTANWRQAAAVGTLDPGHSTLVSTGCGFLLDAIDGFVANWVRVEGVDPWGVFQSSLPAPFGRDGPPVAVSRPDFSLVRGSCEQDSPQAIGMMGYNPDIGRPSECTSWTCELGWHSPGSLVDLQMTVPAIDPNGTPVAGYELLINGNVVAGAPDLIPGVDGHVVLDLATYPDGDYAVSERYLFAPGDQGMLSSCVQSTTMRIDRAVSATITNPTSGEVLCPDQGLVPIIHDVGEEDWSTVFLIDGSADAIGMDPATAGPAISVPALEPGPHTLEASIVDLAGNAVCPTVEFVSEGVAAVIDLDASPRVFSPVNTIGRPTETIVSFVSTADAAYTIEIRDELDDPVAASSGNVTPGETISHSWDGHFDGSLLPDGSYGVWIRLESDCGAVYESPEPLLPIHIDTESPDVVVTSPAHGTFVQTALVLQALATDTHFERWEARIQIHPAVPGNWTVFATGERPSTDPTNVLARWTTTQLPPGLHVVEFEATDIPGNRIVTDQIEIFIQTPMVIASFGATPVYFSPNGDGLAEITEFEFELIQESTVTITDEGTMTVVENQVFPAGTPQILTWDGMGHDANPVPDGPYSVSLFAEPTFGFPPFEAAETTVIVDRVLPIVVITSPQDGALTSLPVTISGFSSDPHADDHTVSLLHPDGSSTVLSDGLGDWSGAPGTLLSELPDGQYSVIATASDLALNQSVVEHDFVIDATAPSALITAPPPGEVLDPSIQPFVFRGSITAAHPETYAWWIADGAAPEPGAFVLIHEAPLGSGGTVEHVWTGPPPADGVHTIRLTALDQLGRTAEDRRLVTIDAASPDVEIWAPTAGAIVTEPIVITGNVADANLSHWTLEEITAGPTVRLLAAGTGPTDGQLIDWSLLPDDGPVTLRLSARDHADHTSETTVGVEVAVLPPGPPVGLTAQVVNGNDVELSWMPGTGPVPVGYHVLRNGSPITGSPVVQPVLTDPQLLDGAYTYEVIAIGPMGRESEPSAPAGAVVNITPPTVVLTSPSNGGRVGAEVEIHGTAFANEDFSFWEIAARATGSPTWIAIDTATAPVIAGFMSTWITQLPPWSDGPHELLLTAEDTFGNRAEHVISIVIDNTPPDPGPVNLQATLVALDPDGFENDVQLGWSQSPVPPDLAGFYLYRNGLLANSPGPVIGDPSPYLISGTSFDDTNIADGSYTYGVAAADTAGNVSALSNPAGPIDIDVRRPHAVITSPPHGTEIEDSVEIIAECADGDVVTLDLHYRLSSQPDWTQMAPTFSGPPYTTVFTPPEHGLYHVRALAADVHGPDPAPHIIDLVAADLPPEAPLQLTARVTGDEVNLAWIAPPDPGNDLAGFDIERNGTVVNTELLPPDTLAFLDTNLTDGAYEFRVVAVDHALQRGSSEPAAAAILTPYWDWLEPVTWSDSLSMTGRGAHPFGSVEIQRFTPGQTVLTVAVLDADVDGHFELDDRALSPGVNSFTAISTDEDANTSRISLPILIVSSPFPEAPGDLTAVPNGGDVSLAWTTPPDPTTAGFAISRDGSVINEPISVFVHDSATHTLSASGGDPSTWGLVVDGDPSTGWAPERVPTRGSPEWWSWMWPDPLVINEITVSWSQTDPPQVFDVEILTEGGWLWLATVNWNGQPIRTIPVAVWAAGVRIRLPMTGSCGSAACLPQLNEIDVTGLDRTLDHEYLDEGLPDGVFTYEVIQNNIWGQQSWPSTVSVSVGPDQPAPPTDLTVSTTGCSGLALEWLPAPAQPGTLVGYRVYRSEQATGPFTAIGSVGPTQTSMTDGGAPVGQERHYHLTARVDMGGVVVESQPTTPAFGTATCVNPPPPVITYPTVAGQPIQITPPQVPIWIRGNSVSGSTVTLIHNGTPVATVQSTSLFTFFDVDVIPGVNTYLVRQEIHDSITDSAPIEVELDPSLLSNLEAVSLAVAPEVAAPGDFVMIEGTVELHPAAGGTLTVPIAFELQQPNGAVSEIYRTYISLDPGESATVRTTWDAALPAGLYRWTFVVDPDDEIVELDETDNTTSATSRVLFGDGLELGVNIDRSVYLVGQQLAGSVFFASSEPARDYQLETRIEDSSGQLVAMIDSRILTGFGDDWIVITIDHPLVGLYPGLYRVRTAAIADGAVVAEDLAPFQLEQPFFVEAVVATDRTSYPEGTPVAVRGRIRNLGPVFLDSLTAILSVVEETTGQTVDHGTIPNIGVTAGGEIQVSWSWSSAGAQHGPYRAAMAVNDEAGTTVATATPFSFTVVPGDVRLTAEITLSASPVEPGDAVNASVAVENTGPTDLTAVDLTVSLIDPVELLVIEEHIHSADLPAGAGHVFEQPLNTTGLALRRYVVLVSASGDGDGPFNIDLSSTSLEIADLSAPDVLILEPAGSGVACTEIIIEAEVTDALSRVARVFHYLDDETTPVGLHLEDPSLNPNLYSAARPLPPGIDGPHQIRVYAEDTAGNLGDGVIAAFDADTAPPILQVAGPADGVCLSGPVAYSFTATDAHLVSLTAFLNGQPYSSGAPITVEGVHQIEISAIDACGREAFEMRGFTLDSTPPGITIDGVTPGGEVLLGTLLEWTVEDPNLISATATLDGSVVVSPVTLDDPGPHTLRIIADDCASNNIDFTVSFTVIEAILALGGTATASPAILEPGQILTIGGTVTNSGTTLNSVQLTLDVVQSSTSIVVASHEEILDLTAGQSHTATADIDTQGWDLDAYEVRFSATGMFLGQPFDLPLATAAVTLADLTAPQLAVPSPSPGLACQEIEVIAVATDNLTGVREVNVAVDGGVPLALTHTGGDIWSAVLALDDGTHGLEIVAVDFVDNSSAPIVIGVDLDTEAPTLTVTAPDDDSCIAGSATIEFTADDPHLDAVTATLNGALISSGHVIDEDGVYELVITATDACGLETTDERQFVLDTIDPEITISGVVGGETYVIGVTGEWAVTDENLVSVEATLDGKPIDSVFTISTPGLHLLEIDAEDCAGNTAGFEAEFETVLPEDGLIGTVNADPVQIEPPSMLVATATITNIVDSPYTAITARLEIAEPGTGQVIDSFEVTIDLPAGGRLDLEHSFATDGLGLGEYDLRFGASGTAFGNAFATHLASETFEIVDLTAPSVRVIEPAPGLACGPVEILATAEDGFSGVAAVHVFVDGEPGGLQLTEVGGGDWTIELTLGDGPHDLVVVAVDIAGNQSDSDSVEIDLDLTPPDLSLAAPWNGQCLRGPATITFSAEDAHLDEVRARLNGSTIVSGTVITEDGAYELQVAATDACGLTDTLSTEFVIDATPPDISVLGVTDGGEYPPPVLLEWVIDDENPVSHAATLDGEPIEPGALVEAPGEHILIIEAEDCAGNTGATAIGFTVIEEQQGGLETDPPSLTARGSVLLLDRSPAGSGELERWLADHVGRVATVIDACAFVTELRRSRHELVVLYAPTGSTPLDLRSCPGGAALDELASELSATAYRHGGVLVLGEGMEGDGCLGCLLDAHGSSFHDQITERVDAVGTTSIIEADGEITIFDLRPMSLTGGFPLLLGGAGTQPVCDGIKTASLGFETGLTGAMTIDVRTVTPHEILDAEAGEILDGGELDENSHPWVGIAVTRTGSVLSIELRSTFGGALPSWLAVSATVSEPGQPPGTPIETSAWVPIDCGLEAGQTYDRFVVTTLEPLGHDAGQTISAAARRYGRGEALVLPWDVLAAANHEALSSLDQALSFTIPTDRWPAVTGLPLPISFAARNEGAGVSTIRIGADVPPALLLEAWDDPLNLVPVRWEMDIAAGETVGRTLWILPQPEQSVIQIPFRISERQEGVWSAIEDGVVEVEIDSTDRWTELRELRMDIGECAAHTDDPAILATLRDLRVFTDVVALVGDDRSAAEDALSHLSRAFAAAETDELPCLANLRGRLAKLITMWQAHWTATGSAR